jgi:hypothetical protein
MGNAAAQFRRAAGHEHPEHVLTALAGPHKWTEKDVQRLLELKAAGKSPHSDRERTQTNDIGDSRRNRPSQEMREILNK